MFDFFKRRRQASGELLLLSAIVIHMCLAPFAADAADRGQRLDLGLDVGYVATSIPTGNLPSKVHGASFGLGLRYELDDAWFLGLEARFDVHQSYQIYPLVPQQEATAPSEGAQATQQQGPTVDPFFLSSLALGVGYYIDVYRIVPYLGAWLVGLRVDRVSTVVLAPEDGRPERLTATQIGYDLGARVGLGVDFDITTHVTTGLSFGYEWFLTGATSYGGRLLLMARLAYRFGNPRDPSAKIL
ncbi:MAG: outer membrane beta-barrel protein [Myxococcota bacterium]|jgi:opacity protein-like surface antigen|nr:outer membrane beta-barrel protein [Myxococcota bacterium]